MDIPVAYCSECKGQTPVIMENVWVEETKSNFAIIYCPVCESVLNGYGDIEVQYFEKEDMGKIGWKIVDE